MPPIFPLFYRFLSFKLGSPFANQAIHDISS
jgi:hypothetical protein